MKEKGSDIGGDYPMRINRYLALKGVATRKEADTLIERGVVYINERRAVLGDKVTASDIVEVKKSGKPKVYRYVAYHKPRGVETHASGEDKEDIKGSTSELTDLQGLFPVGRLDKESHGLIILTNDGRITDRLLNPDRTHDKEYTVKVREKLRDSFKKHMEAGVTIGDYVTRPAIVNVMGEHIFSITLTEGKKHQIRRMAEAMHLTVIDLKRIRVLNVSLGRIPPGGYRVIEGTELETFLRTLGL